MPEVRLTCLALSVAYEFGTLGHSHWWISVFGIGTACWNLAALVVAVNEEAQ